MRTGSSSATDPRASERRARAWYLFAQFDVVMHPRLVNSDTYQILPEYVREVIAARERYLDALARIQGLKLIT